MRLFYAVKIPDEVKDAVAKFIDPFRSLPGKVKWVESKNLHLTLKFIGETEKILLPELEKAAWEAIKGVESFEIELSDCGAFPNLRSPRVFWIGIKDSEKRLTNLQKKLDYNLNEIGFEAERKKFSPHLTLGRVKSNSGLSEVKESFSQVKFGSHIFKIDAMYLIESQLRPQGPVYTDLKEFSF